MSELLSSVNALVCILESLPPLDIKELTEDSEIMYQSQGLPIFHKRLLMMVHCNSYEEKLKPDRPSFVDFSSNF